MQLIVQLIKEPLQPLHLCQCVDISSWLAECGGHGSKLCIHPIIQGHMHLICYRGGGGGQATYDQSTVELSEFKFTVLKANYLFNAMLCRPQTAGGEFLGLTIIYSSVACLLSLPIVQALTLFCFFLFF